MKTILKAIASALLVLFLFSACKTSIGAIAADPERYADRTVSVTGTVKAVLKVPFSEYSILSFADGDGEAAVFTVETYTKGDQVTLEVKVIAFPAGQLRMNGGEAVTAIADFLVAKGLASRDSVDVTAKRAVKAIGRVADGMGKTFFLIEN